MSIGNDTNNNDKSVHWSKLVATEGVNCHSRGLVSLGITGNDTNKDDRSALDCKLVGKEGVNR